MSTTGVCVHTVSHTYTEFVSESISGRKPQYFLCSFYSFHCSHVVCQCYKQTKMNVLSETYPFVSIYGFHDCRDGSVCGWSSQSGQLQFCQPHAHRGDIVAVDMCGNVVVSGSHDRTVKVWQVSEQGLVIPKLSIDVGDRVWALSFRPQGDIFCVGSAGYHQVPPLHVFDIER
jgi:hypothetical protein